MSTTFTNLLAANYNKLYNFTGSTSTFGSFSVALQYALNGRMYNGLEHEAVVKQLKMPMPLGSVMHGYGNDPILLDKIAAKLIVEGNVEQAIKQLHKNIELLKAEKFSSGYNLNYSALFLQDEAHAKRAKQFFDEMKRQQRLLTRKSDYPMTLLLTKEPHDPKQLASTLYQYYEALKKNFKIGDQLQMLAQFLTHYSPKFEPQLVDYTVQIKAALEQRQIKVSRQMYPLVGLLALNATTEEKLDEMMVVKEQVAQHKQFNAYPEMPLIAAVMKCLTDDYAASALTGEVQADWFDLLFFSDVLFVIPKSLIEGVLSADFSVFN